MIRVAIYETSNMTNIINRFINNLYNQMVVPYGGEELEIVATVRCGNICENESDISLQDYINLYKKGEIDALIIPVYHFVAQAFVLTDILKAGLSLDDVYILKRIEGKKLETPEDVLNQIDPYLSAKYIPYLEYHVADNCNLNCIACEHYSGLVKGSVLPDFCKFTNEFAKMKELIDDIGTIRILGGEPLLNPELASYINLSRELYPYSKIVVVTNGILVRQMDESLINSIKRNDVVVEVSYYPPMIDQISKIRNFFIDHNIRYSISPLNTKFTKKQTLNEADNTNQYYKCFQAHCNNMYQGKMAPCFLPFTTKYFNEQYSTHLPEDEAISIMGDITSEELLWGLLQPIERCRYCTNPVDVEWDYVKDKEDLSNWLVEVPREEEKNKPLITIYTQCYNGEKYIEKCILSVINQTYSNFEYYVCNHGSSDGTQDIIDKYAALDSRIIPIYFPNNERGFYPDYIKANAKGKYFAMLDSDDWWNESHLQKLVDFSERYNLDMSMCGINQYTEATQEYSDCRHVDNTIVFNVAELNVYLPIVYRFLRTTWGKLIRMEMLEKADFSTYYINAQTFISDDTAFSLACFESCNRVGIIPEVLLTYRVTDSSVTAKYKNSLVENNYNIYLQLQGLLRNMKVDTDENENYIYKVFAGAMDYSIWMLLDSTLTVDEKYKELMRIFKLPYICELLKDEKMKNSNLVNNVNIWINNNRKYIPEIEYASLVQRFSFLLPN